MWRFKPNNSTRLQITLRTAMDVGRRPWTWVVARGTAPFLCVTSYKRPSELTGVHLKSKKPSWCVPLWLIAFETHTYGDEVANASRNFTPPLLPPPPQDYGNRDPSRVTYLQADVQKARTMFEKESFDLVTMGCAAHWMLQDGVFEAAKEVVCLRS